MLGRNADTASAHKGTESLEDASVEGVGGKLIYTGAFVHVKVPQVPKGTGAGGLMFHQDTLWFSSTSRGEQDISKIIRRG